MEISVRIPATDTAKRYISQHSSPLDVTELAIDHYYKPSRMNLSSFNPLTKAVRVRVKGELAEFSFNRFIIKNIGYYHEKIVLSEGRGDDIFQLVEDMGFVQWGKIEHWSERFLVKAGESTVSILLEHFSVIPEMIKMETHESTAITILLKELGIKPQEIVSQNSAKLLADTLGLLS